MRAARARGPLAIARCTTEPQIAAVPVRLRPDRRAALPVLRADRRSRFARLLACHFAVPAGMMKPRPVSSHGTARHGAERSRLCRGAEVNVSEQTAEEEDEGDVVDENADF